MTYTIRLDGEKYTVTNDDNCLRFHMFGLPQHHLPFGLVLAMAQRIEELEVAIKAVVDGSLQHSGIRAGNGLKHYGGLDHERTLVSEVRMRKWEETLRDVLEQKP